MTDITFDVYALCYNEAHIIPSFLHHYRHARNIYVWDNMSTDNSRDLVVQAGRHVAMFNTQGKFNDKVHSKLKDIMWKKSKQEGVDFVIIQDMDEFVHFPEYSGDILSGLRKLKEQKISGVICEGYEMCDLDGNFWKNPDPNIINRVYTGFPSKNYNKPLIFSPASFKETNFEVGQHEWSPELEDDAKMGIYEGKVLLLHYKHLGFEWELNKRKEIRARYSDVNQAFVCSIEYTFSDEEMRKYVETFYDREKCQDFKRDFRNLSNFI